MGSDQTGAFRGWNNGVAHAAPLFLRIAQYECKELRLARISFDVASNGPGSMRLKSRGG